jgi:hypothetical protein
MEYLLAPSFLILSFFGMALGFIISKKVLQKGCSRTPDSDPNEPCGFCGKKSSECPNKKTDTH